VTGLRSATRLYRLYLAVAGTGVALVLAVGGSVIAGTRWALPSLGSVGEACDRWLSAGGPTTLVSFLLGLLALATVAFGLRSAWRQVAASRRFLGALPVAERQAEVDGVAVVVIDAAEPQAFCAGYIRPRTYLSRGALEQLTSKELRAVVAHELHHLRRRDPLRLLIARALADALFFVPLLGRVSDRYAALGELAADEAAVGRLQGRGALASALLKFSGPGAEPAPVVAVAPERVDHLLGDAAAGRWGLPPSLAAVSALVMVGLVAVLASAWHGLFAPALELSLLLSAGCMALMVGGPLALAAAGAVVIPRRALRARRA
jgi:Zn-dependent protease with chaperone function